MTARPGSRTSRLSFWTPMARPRCLSTTTRAGWQLQLQPGSMRAAISVEFDEADADLAGKVLVTQDVDGNASDDIDSDASEADGQTTRDHGRGSARPPRTTTRASEDPGTAAITGRVFCDENDDSLDNGEAGVGRTSRLCFWTPTARRRACRQRRGPPMAATASPGSMRAAISVDFDEADDGSCRQGAGHAGCGRQRQLTTSTAMPPRPMARRA